MNDPGRELSRLLHSYTPEPERPLSYDAVLRSAEQRPVQRYAPILIGVLVLIMLTGTVFGVRALGSKAGSNNSAANSSGRSETPSRPGSATPSRSATTSPSTTSPIPPPTALAPRSVAGAGGSLWLVGMQPCGEKSCPTVTRSTDAGRSWQKLAAPATDLSNAEVTFADDRNGWIIAIRTDPMTGPLYATHDGGQSWHLVELADVAQLATSANKVWATVRTQGEVYSLYQATVGSDRFAKVADPPGADVVAQNGAAYVWNSGGYSGARIPPSAVFMRFSASGSTTVALPCTGPYAVRVVLAADRSNHVLVVCGTNGAAGNELKRLYESVAGDAQWTMVSTPPEQGYINTLAVEGNTLVLTGPRMPIAGSTDAGRHWTVSQSDVGDASGFGRAVLTDPAHGYLTGAGSLYETSDSGRTWQPSSIH